MIEASVYRDYMAIPYLPMGRDHDGADCWGITRLILLEQIGIELNEHPGQITADESDIELEAIASGWVQVESPTDWDIAVFKVPWEGWHIVLMLSSDAYLTTSAQRGIYVDSMCRPAFLRIKSPRFYRYG